MNLNNQRIIKGEVVNQIYQKRINEIGMKKFLKELKDISRKKSIPLIKNSYESFKKDVKCAPYSGMKDKATLSMINTIKENKNDLPIFEIENDNIEYKIKFPLIPFNKFYIATNIIEEIDYDLYQIGGFFVLDYDKDFLCVIYYWSRIVNDGWAFSSFIQRKDGLKDNFNENKCGFSTEVKTEVNKKINLLAMKKFDNLMKKLIYKINKKEYSTYKKYSYGNYIEKKISFAYDVRSHKRHFWKDSGRFKIPLMSKEKIISKGYEIDELVFKDNELRRNVPFKIVSEFKIGEIKEENKVYDLTEKKIFRQEEKVLKILKEIFPNNFIRRHDRKLLKGLELDFILPELRLAFEYDGEQHFDKKLCEKIFKSDFNELKKRDRKKDKLCIKKNIILIRIKYDEPITKKHINMKLKKEGIK